MLNIEVGCYSCSIDPPRFDMLNIACTTHKKVIALFFCANK